jgi:uncharacterized protein (DUF302 family)
MRWKAFGRISIPAIALALSLAAAPLTAHPATAAEEEPESVGPYPGTVSWQTEYAVGQVVRRLEKAVRSNGMTLVTTVNSGGHGQTSAAVILVSSGDYWGRILRSSQLAGMEMPIRIYVADGASHKASVIYRAPSSIFALYDNPELDKAAAELDQIFAKIVDDAIGE